jgi:hypothetical protein
MADTNIPGNEDLAGIAAGFAFAAGYAWLAFIQVPVDGYIKSKAINTLVSAIIATGFTVLTFAFVHKISIKRATRHHLATLNSATA